MNLYLNINDGFTYCLYVVAPSHYTGCYMEAVRYGVKDAAPRKLNQSSFRFEDFIVVGYLATQQTRLLP